MNVQTMGANNEKIANGTTMSVNEVKAGATVMNEVPEVAEEAKNGKTMDGKMNVAMRKPKEKEVGLDRLNGASDERRRESANSGKSARRKRKWNGKRGSWRKTKECGKEKGKRKM